MRRILLAAVLYSCLLYSPALGSQFRLAPLFGDNMVLEQKRAVPVWGEGTPGTRITLKASWKKEASTLVRPDGSWSLTVVTPRAGGPYEISVGHDDSTTVIKNVLVGEVWLCSGQSNMEMPLEGWPPDSVLNAEEEIRNASYPRIRLFTVKRAYAATPQSQCAGAWDECSPKTAHSFSAAAYFFGRTLHRTLGVPVGLVNSSWGGTAAESWISRDSLYTVARYDSVLDKISVTAESLKTFQAWLGKFPVVDVGKRDREARWQNLGLGDDSCALPSFNDRAWQVMNLPTYWEKTQVGEFDGVVWFRRQVSLPASWLHRDLVVELGPVDDMDATYFNGACIGAHESEGEWNVGRVYAVPARLVDSTLVTIAVRVIDNGGGGGLYGAAKMMSIHPRDTEEKVSLTGEWRYLPVADYLGNRLYVFGLAGEQYFHRPRLPFDFSGYAPTALYNGMIAPLAPFTVAGVIWYQGESNTGDPAMYRTLLPLLVRNWRTAFRMPGLPFEYVQIAPYEYGPATQSALLREAEFLTLGVKNTAMAVTLDIGKASDIHPPNKQEVGRRLALLALANTYGKNIVASGPVYRSKKIVGNAFELSFGNVAGGLIITGSERGNGFQVAGEDHLFRPADAEVRGSMVIVSSPLVNHPIAVRYAFGNSSQATLYNSAGLPSSSFRTDDWAH